MQNSGTKLVLAITGLALLLGVFSWWYRYEAAHRASQFWGPEESRLIAESENFAVWESESAAPADTPDLPAMATSTELRDLSAARGQAHLRHALLSDRNYVWDQPLEADQIDWRWHLQFKEDSRQVTVMLSSDLTAIGKAQSDNSVAALSCQPMTASLKQYFEALKLLPKSEATASTSAE